MTARNGPAFVPRVPASIVGRDRLLGRLDAEPRHPLVVVRAPAGAGKTTLLVDWLARSPRPAVWVTIDPADGRRLAFWERVVVALGRADALPPDSTLRDLYIGPEIADSLRGTLLSGLREQPERLLLVLDDFQHVGDPQVADDLSWLIAAGAPLDLVVSSRTPTVFEEPAQRARIDTLVLGPAELAFDAAETVAAARLAGVPDDAAPAIHEATTGLALSIRATLLELDAHPTWPASRAIESVQSHGAALLLSSDDGPYQEFLLRLSVATAANSALIERLAGPGAASHLARAEHDGVGSWRDQSGGRAFALQPYLRAYLLTELQRRDPQEAARLQGVYGDDLAERGDLMGAIQQLASAGDWDAVTRVVLTGYSELMRLHVEELCEVLATAGSSVLRRQPILLSLLVLLDNSRKSLPSTTLLHKANLAVALIEARLGVGNPRDRAPLLVALLGTQRLGGHYDSALETADRLVAVLAADEDGGRHALLGLYPTAFLHVATSYLYSERLDQAEPLFRVAAEISLESDRPWTELHASSMRLLVRATRGRLDPAELATARNRSRPSGWRGTYQAAGFHLAEAYEALERFDTADARSHLDELAAHEHTIEHWPLIARLRGLAALVEGSPYLGLERLAADIASHADRPPTSRWMATLLAVTRADLLLAEGESHRAAATLRPSRLSPTAALARGRVHFATGRYEQVIAQVAHIAWAEVAFPRPKAEALLLTAVAAVALGRESEARLAATRALELLADTDLRRPLMMVRRTELSAVLSLVDRAEVLDGVPDVFPPDESTTALTASELRVLEGMHESGSTEDIAGALYLSINTVKSHQRSIYRKLGVRTREAALAVATLRGILDADSDEL